MRPVTILAIIAVAGAVALSLMSVQRPLQAGAPEDTAFNQWVGQFRKVYKTPAERTYRRTVFTQNLMKVNEFNKVYKHRSGLNEFSDLTFEEFKAKYTGLVLPQNEEKTYADLSGISQAASVDWRTQGVVNPIKNQGQCGSCWAFSATSAIESAWKLAGNALISLAEQQMVDCSMLYGNQGCNGGWMNRAFLYVKTVGGQELESTYPYTAKDGKCAFNKANIAAKIKGYTDLPTKNCDALKSAVNARPVAVAVEVTASFQAYKGGVYSVTDCGVSVNHAVNVVGYGTDSSSNLPYWIVRNSWGTSWGNQGYIYMDSSVQMPDGLCAICDYGTYPSV